MMLSTIEKWSKDVACPHNTESGCEWYVHYAANSDDIYLLHNVISFVLMAYWFIQIAD